MKKLKLKKENINKYYSNKVALLLKDWNGYVTIASIITITIVAIASIIIKSITLLIIGLAAFLVMQLIAISMLAKAEIIQKLQNIEDSK